MIKRIWILLILGLMSCLYSQSVKKLHLLHSQLFKSELTTVDADIPSPLSNSITDIIVRGDSVVFGSGRGLSFYDYDSKEWKNYDESYFRNHGGISAADISDDGTIWVATAFDTLAGGSELSAGGGLFYLERDSLEWKWIPQPMDQQSDSSLPNIELPVVTNIQNVTYDIEAFGNEVWIASWGGGIRRSRDRGRTWEVVTPDGQPFNVLSQLDHRGFALLHENGNIWIGTAAGIAKSEDDGNTWRIYTASPQQTSPAGNWCIELKYQPSTGWIWATTIKTFAENEYEFTAVSVTKDGGATWSSYLKDELSDGSFPRYIDFIGDTIIVAAENGVYLSEDLGDSWKKLGYIIDWENGEKILNNVFYSVGVKMMNPGFECWIGSDDGLISTTDFHSYKIFRKITPGGTDKNPESFAYPNPFSPDHGDYLRIQFKVDRPGTATVTIYNQAMEKVTEFSENVINVTQKTDRSVNWDGLDSRGKKLPNGLYIYKLNINGKTYWGKILMMN